MTPIHPPNGTFGAGVVASPLKVTEEASPPHTPQYAKWAMGAMGPTEPFLKSPENLQVINEAKTWNITRTRIFTQWLQHI